MLCSISLCLSVLGLVNVWATTLNINQTREHGFENEESTNIINGQALVDGQFPFMASLSTRTSSSLLCGASILSPEYLLTAAHCVSDGTKVNDGGQFKVGVGSVYLPNLQYHQVERFYVHRAYRAHFSDGYDIALIKLAEPLKLEKGRVETIELPSQNAPVPKKVGSIGWGQTSNMPGNPKQLHGLELYTINSYECSRRTKNQVSKLIFCDEGGDKGTCYVSSSTI